MPENSEEATESDDLRLVGRCEYCGHPPGCYCVCPIRRGHLR